MYRDLASFGVAALMILGMLFVYGRISGNVAIWKVAMGSDGHPSTSKLQAFLWTIVVLVAYLAIVVAGWQEHHTVAPIGDIPPNILLAMGLSFGTAVGAAAITTSQVASGHTTKPAAQESPQGLRAIFTDDDGRPDLGKVQLMIWTAVALGIFFARRLRWYTTLPRPAVPRTPPFRTSMARCSS